MSAMSVAVARRMDIICARPRLLARDAPCLPGQVPLSVRCLSLPVPWAHYPLRASIAAKAEDSTGVKMLVRLILSALVILVPLIPITSVAVEIYDHFPDTIHAKERYVIYSHGLIVEGNDP